VGKGLFDKNMLSFPDSFLADFEMMVGWSYDIRCVAIVQ
jgi:hypothetical protein